MDWDPRFGDCVFAPIVGKAIQNALEAAAADGALAMGKPERELPRPAGFSFRFVFVWRWQRVACEVGVPTRLYEVRQFGFYVSYVELAVIFCSCPLGYALRGALCVGQAAEGWASSLRRRRALGARCACDWSRDGLGT